MEHGVSGILVAPRDIMGLATAIEQLALASDLRARLGLSGRQKVLREFDLVSNAEALATLFDRSTRETLPALEAIAA